jgi:hypothetical protein
MSAARATSASILALALTLEACGGSGARSAASALDTEVSERDSIVPGAAVEAQVEQTGNEVTFTARGTCDLHRIVTVDQTMVHSTTTGSSGGSYGNLGVVGGLMLGGGAIVGGSLVINEATTTPTVNPGAKVVGGALLGLLGIGLTGVMIWTLTPGANRSSGTYTSVERADRDDGLVQSNVPCEDVHSIPGFIPIMGRLPGPKPIEIGLGSTDNRGKLRFDVTRAIPPELLTDPATPKTMPIYFRGVNAGIVRIDGGGSAEKTGSTWDPGAAAACAAATTVEACAPVESYLREFPKGLHAAEARVALSRIEAARAAVASAREKDQLRQVAADARAAAATRAAKEGAQAACRKICATSCKGAVDCTNSCAEKSCH